MLKWLTKKTYATLSEVLGAVHKELEELQPVDTDSIKWTKGMEGMRAELNRELLGGGGLEEQEAEDGSEPIYARVKLLNYPRTMRKYMSVVITGYDDTETSIETGFSSSNPPELPTLVSDYNEISTGTLPNTLPFGVLQQEFSLSNPTSNICTVILSGLTLAWVYLERIQDDKIYCTLPTSYYGYLYAANHGLAKIIWRPAAQSGTALCIVNMGSGYDSRYFGAFKVGVLDDKLYLYDGSNPTSVNAGIIYAGSVAKYVAKTELAFVASDIYVGITYLPEDESWITWVHQGYITTSPYYTDERTYYTRVAVYGSNGVVTQINTTGQVVVQGRWVP